MLLRGGTRTYPYFFQRETGRAMSPAASPIAAVPENAAPSTDTASYPVLSPNGALVVKKRYAMHTHDGEPLEDWDGVCRRVAHTLARAEVHYDASRERIAALEDEFFASMRSHSFIPGGRTLANCGADTPLVPNCIVLHIQDSLADIFATLREAALLQQRGSGLGFPFHLLRPAGAVTHVSHGTSSGPLSFLRVYNAAFGVIKQQGRHGANMATYHCSGPDLLEIINAKRVEGEIANFNVSICLSNEFMDRVISGSEEPWMCRFGGVDMLPRRIARDNKGLVESITPVEMSARAIFAEMIDAAWHNGEPGCLFIDRAERDNPLPSLGRLEATNPCGNYPVDASFASHMALTRGRATGEQFLGDGDACNLGSINIGRFLVVGADGALVLDEARLRAVVATAVRMLDAVVDLVDTGSERVEETFKKNRRIGLGVMGLADSLYRLRVPYDRKGGRAFAARVMRIIQEAAHAASRALAKEKGAFANLEFSIYADDPHRNATLTNVPPTGSTAMIVDASSGIEPHFLLAFRKHGVMGGETLYYVNSVFEEALDALHLSADVRAAVVASVAKHGTLRKLDAELAAQLPDEMHRVFVVAGDISPKDHVKMQACIQKYCDNSISKTINYPNDATREDIMNGYIYAYKMGCKGLTAYRDGSRVLQVLSSDTTGSASAEMRDGAPCPDCTEGVLRNSEGCISCTMCGSGMCV